MTYRMKRLLKAFTMAEAILVMTILGVIATIMITTIKPAEYKEKALKIMAKKVLQEIDQATMLIQANDTLDGSFYQLVSTYGSHFSINQGDTNLGDSNNLLALYKKYLTTTHKDCGTSCACQNMTLGTNATGVAFAYLKDGACIGLNVAAQAGMNIIFPGETKTGTARVDGFIGFDTNGDEEPNMFGKDRFILPLSKEGIQYDITVTYP